MIINAADWQRPELKGADAIGTKVKDMLNLIKVEGDDAVNKFALQFDQIEPQLIDLKPFDEYQLPEPLSESIRLAAKRIEDFANFQKQSIKSQSFNDKYGLYAHQSLNVILLLHNDEFHLTTPHSIRQST